MTEDRYSLEEILELKAAFDQLDPLYLTTWAKCFLKFYVRMAGGNEALIEELQNLTDKIDFADAIVWPAIEYYNQETGSSANPNDLPEVIQWLIDERERLK